MRKGASRGRSGIDTISLRASWRVWTWTVLSPTLTSTPFHQGMFSVGLSKFVSLPSRDGDHGDLRLDLR